jgi:putative hydrolase of the HAD superfamily
VLEAILFDLDNTLIDWTNCEFFGNWNEFREPHLNKFYPYLCELGTPTIDLDKFKELYAVRMDAAWEVGRTTLKAPHLGRILVDIAIEIGISEDKLDMAACLDAYGWGEIEGVVVFPDVFEALTLLRDNGIRFGIVTNSSQPMYTRDIELVHYDLLEYFPECRLSASDVGYLKPHSNIFQAALDRLGTAAQNTIFVGDNLNADIYGAQQMGMKGVWRDVGRNHLSSNDVDITPDATIKSLLELPTIIDEWFPNNK